MKIKFYTNICGGCRNSDKEDDVRRFMIRNEFPLSSLTVVRQGLTEIDDEFIKRVGKKGIELPFCVVDSGNGNLILSHDDFLKWAEQYEEDKNGNNKITDRQVKAKRAKSKADKQKEL